MSDTEYHTSEAAASEVQRRRLTAGAFRRVFVDNPDGRIVWAALQKMAASQLWVKGGVAARRETDHNLGKFALVNFINRQINIANGIEEDQSDVGMR